MITYNKSEIREQLNIDQIFELLTEWGGDPQYAPFGIISTTICHNKPGEGSRKLYYYSNTGLLQCWTGCGYFDIFELCRKVAKIQWNKEFDLNDAVRYVAHRFGIAGREEDDDGLSQLEDWKIFSAYNKLQDVEIKGVQIPVLKPYDDTILSRMNYRVIIRPWLNEGISQEVLSFAKIGYYPGEDQITIPHWDMNGNFIGLRGRTLIESEAAAYGKYRPVRANNTLYNHPLGMNLYGLSWAKDNIKKIKKAIIFESEKSVLMYMSYFGIENNIAVACCGSNISSYQIEMLKVCGAEEIVVALDRQFVEIGDEEYKHLIKNFMGLHKKYGQLITVSFIFDKNLITGYKASPIDEGPDKFLQLFKERVIL